MVKPLINDRDISTIRCDECTVLIFDGCGTHTTLGYMLPDYGPIFRQMFDASLAMLPVGSHFVTGAKVNYKVLPNKDNPKAHSYMIGFDRGFLHNHIRYAHWVGEFFPAYDLVNFIEAVWEATKRRISTLVRNEVLKPSKWPAENDELSHKTNLHCSLPATINNNIIGGKWDGITHCSALSGNMPDKSNHGWMTLAMNEHFGRCLDLLEGGRILRTHLDGHYVFAPHLPSPV